MDGWGLLCSMHMYCVLRLLEMLPHTQTMHTSRHTRSTPHIHHQPREDKGLKLKCLSEQTKPFCFFAFCLEKKGWTLNSPLFTFCIIKWSTQLIHLAFCIHYLLYTLYMFSSHCGCKLNTLTVNAQESSGLHEVSSRSKL